MSAHEEARPELAVQIHPVPKQTTGRMPLPARSRGHRMGKISTPSGAIPSGPAKTLGLALGRAAAAVILAARTTDGSDTPLFDAAYPQGTQPGEYRFTPGSDFAFAPGWSDVTPFVLNASSQFRPGPPYAVTSKRYAKDFREVKRLGGDGVNTPSARTADQTQVALFRVESSPLRWNRIARTVATRKGLDLWENAPCSAS